MVFALKEASRDRSNPVKLFLFRGADPALESMLKSVTVIPGTTEFGYGTTRVSDGQGAPKNWYAGADTADFARSLDDLIAAVPGIRNVSLVVAWHGTDLRAGTCQIRPRVETAAGTTTPYVWRVGNLTRATAQVVSQIEGQPAYGGAPSDRSVFEAIRAIKNRGLRCTFYPFVMMDIAAGNTFPNPYGGTGQPAYPWRGRITCNPAPDMPGTADGTATAGTQIATFFGSVGTTGMSWNASEMRVEWIASSPSEVEWSYRKFVLHMSHIAAAAGVDDFLIGSEFVGLTKVRDETGAYPAVERFRTLATDCRGILGPSVRLSYAADWSEFHSHRVGNNINFNMDRLWSHDPIDFIGIDNYLPNADWRDGFTHLDWLAGFSSIHDISYLQRNIEGGEYFDWYYASEADRAGQRRTPILDGAYDEPWVWRQKDIRNWWANAHHNRVAGVRQAVPTGWVPRSKPIVFTEIGCPAINKGANQPNVFVDAKSSESAVPYFSNGRGDTAMLRAFLEANIRYWQKNNEHGFIETDTFTAWTWDARPYPTFPSRGTLFGDSSNWATGHWLTGRVQPGRSFESGDFGPFAFCDGEETIVRDGIAYEPWPIKHSDITASGTLDNSELTVTLATSNATTRQRSAQVESFLSAFVGYPPSQVINLTVFQGQMDDEPSLVEYPAAWLGRANAPQWNDNEIVISCLPVSSSIQRPGLRRNYQLGCPHVLYGSQCRASKKTATTRRNVAAINRATVTLDEALTGFANYRGGMAEWVGPQGQREVRTIIDATASTVKLRGTVRGLTIGATLSLSLGCNHTLNHCRNLFNNVLNFGGQPLIPLDNPLSQKNQFY